MQWQTFCLCYKKKSQHEILHMRSSYCKLGMCCTSYSKFSLTVNYLHVQELHKLESEVSSVLLNSCHPTDRSSHKEGNAAKYKITGRDR